MREQTMRISGPTDLLQAVPYLLGFHPTDSLVVLGLGTPGGGRLVVTARMDLADLADPPALAQLVAALARGGAGELVAVVYADAELDVPLDQHLGPQRLPWSGLAPALAHECERVGCALGDVLLVADGRWWSYTCESDLCCPQSGTPLADAPSEFVAEATFAGMVALPDRKSLEATLDPVSPDRLAATAQLIAAEEHRGVAKVLAADRDRAARSVKRAVFAAARRADADSRCTLSDADIARFGSALSDIVLRDPVWLAIDAGRLDGRPLWRELARRLPGHYAAGPLFLFGWASWRAGNGALAAIAAERAVERDPAYSAADLLRAALAHGLGPSQVPKLRPRRTRAA